MRSLKVSGKTIDEAIFKGLNELEISIDEVDVNIIQNETKGVFGIGSKPAIVVLTERENGFSKMVEDMMQGGAQVLQNGRAKTDDARDSRQRNQSNKPGVISDSDKQQIPSSRPREPQPKRQASSSPVNNGGNSNQQAPQAPSRVPTQAKSVQQENTAPLKPAATPRPATSSKPVEPRKPAAASAPVEQAKPTKPENENVVHKTTAPRSAEHVKANAGTSAKPLSTGLLSPDVIEALEAGAYDIEAIERRNKKDASSPSVVENKSDERAPYSNRHDDRRKPPYNNNNRRDDRRKTASTPPTKYGVKASPMQAQSTPRPEIPYSLELAQTNESALFLDKLLSLMGVEAKVLCAEHDGGLRLKVESSASDVIIGHRGETLNALQYITSLSANRTRKDDEYLRVTIDAEGYREKREEVLMRLARGKAAEVRRTRRPYRLEPMNPYERRIIHSTLQNHPYVTTHSEGVDPNRRVVITLK